MQKKSQPARGFLYWLLAPWRALVLVVHIIGWIVALMMLGLAVAAGIFFYTLPDVKSMDFEQFKTLAIERNQARLEVKKNLSRWTPLREINRDLLYAVVVAEDGAFFEHRGIDTDALLEAMMTNWRRGEKAFGGSTITQQTVKNLFLSGEKSYLRKLQELVLALRLEGQLSKNEIVELYLNLAEFGPDIYGVTRATAYYFDKKPSAINAAEGAYLALLLPSPRRYHYTLFQNRNVTLQHRRKFETVLRTMRARGYISAVQYNEYSTLLTKPDWPEKRP
ncbi:MAG: transglycosylase domain-containing protein [Campylobacterales bacterium]